MERHRWIEEFQGAVTVCDTEGMILEMNRRSRKMFMEQGGEKLIGTNVLDCHPEPSRTKLREIMDAQRINVYTVEKKGVKKLIYQAPWYEGGTYAGFVEIVVDLPDTMPHFIRGDS